MAYHVASTTSTPDQLAADFNQKLEPADPAQTPHSSVAFVSVSGFDEVSTDEPPADAAQPADAKQTTPTPGASDPAASDDRSDDAKTAKPAADEPAADQAELAAKEGYTDEEWKALGEKTRKRIAKLVKERNIARDERQRLQSPPPPSPTPDPAAPQAPAPDELPPAVEEVPVNKWVPEGFRARPTLEEFDFDAEAHDDALDEWRAELREARRVESQRRVDAQTAATKAVEQAKTAQREYAAAAAEARAQHEDWEEVCAIVPEFKDPRQAQDLDRLISQVRGTDGKPLGPEVAYYLGKNPEALKSLVDAQNPVELAIAFGGIVRDVRAGRQMPAASAETPAPPVPQKPRTQAPAPIHRASGVAVATDDLNDEGISQTEWERRREARMRRAGG